MAASPRNRVFKQALLASLALHAALLAGVPELRPAMTQAVESVPIIARLLDLQPAAAPQDEKKQEEKKPERKREEPAAHATPAVPPVVRPEPAPAAKPAPAAPDPEPVTPSQAPVAVAPPPASAPAAARAQPAETRSADQYRLELIATANRIKERLRYPPQAKDNQWEGDVLLGVVISASGRTSITVKRSSQYEVLDRQAVEILRLATREVSLPPALRGRESALKDLAFEYRLKD